MPILLTLILCLQAAIFYLLITYRMEIGLTETYANMRMRKLEKLIKEL